VVVKFAFKVDFGSKISVQQHCSTTHRLATIHNVTDRQTTDDDRRNTVA